MFKSRMKEIDEASFKLCPDLMDLIKLIFLEVLSRSLLRILFDINQQSHELTVLTRTSVLCSSSVCWEWMKGI